MGPLLLLTRLLRLLGVSRVVAIAVAVYLWRKHRGPSAIGVGRPASQEGRAPRY